MRYKNKLCTTAFFNIRSSPNHSCGGGLVISYGYIQTSLQIGFNADKMLQTLIFNQVLRFWQNFFFSLSSFINCGKMAKDMFLGFLRSFQLQRPQRFKKKFGAAAILKTRWLPCGDLACRLLSMIVFKLCIVFKERKPLDFWPHQ